MRNISLFIRRYAIFIAFVLLQMISLYLLFTTQRIHRAVGQGVMNNVTGFFNSQYTKVESFFTMKAENKRIHALNDSLMNLLSANYIQQKDSTFTSSETHFNTIDSTQKTRQFFWRAAQVVYNTLNSNRNYLQINKGAKDGINDDMGVFSSDGSLVGKVVNTGQNFSEVMSLFHVMNKLNILVKRTSTRAILEWEGNASPFLTIEGIPKSDSVRVGDTIITGNFSLSYPAGKNVGVVHAILKESNTNFLKLSVKPIADFSTIKNVFVVENLFLNEQKALDEATKKKIEASNKK
ncbi:MAG: rod shape-determining protein MreC [Chitinophagaceae bacterium]|nr:MAG: rod shape-determining protein MreC [Chitinophagaceae bacterium]